MTTSKSRKPAATRKTKLAGAESVGTSKVTLQADAPVAPVVEVPTAPVAEAPVVAAAQPETGTKPAKAKKPKLVRDSFTFPETDYALIARLKQRALVAGHEVKKSEILRAGLAALEAMPEAELLKVLGAVERIKTGRPAKK